MNRQKKNYKSFREQLLECEANHTAETIMFKYAKTGIVWCHKHGAQCMSSACRAERMPPAIIAGTDGFLVHVTECLGDVGNLEILTEVLQSGVDGTGKKLQMTEIARESLARILQEICRGKL